MRGLLSVLIVTITTLPLPAQRGAKQTARDLFYAEAGLIVSGPVKGRFASAKKSVIAVTLGVKYRVWKLSGSEVSEWDPAGPFQPGDQIRLGIETNDTGYLYVVHRQPTGSWQRLFPTAEIERGSHFIRSGITYPIPPEDGLQLNLTGGAERVFLVLSREPVNELEVLVSPREGENTVSAAPAPEIPDSLVEKLRNTLNSKDLVTDRAAGEKAVYLVNRSGKADSVVMADIRLGGR